MHPKVVCLMGPTATGKTDLALRLAEDIPCEIVSVDSAMVYRSMDIGTAKPCPLKRAKVEHHLIDINEPWEPYSAAKFQQDALNAIQSIHAKGKLPILVGGTMLYFKALQQGLSPLPEANETIREQLLQDASKIGWQEMHARLTKIDPESAQRINPNDPQRIQRALEVYEITHSPLSALWKDSEKYQLPFECLNIAIAPQDRAVLHEKIEQRFEKMLAEGFLEEVEKLHKCEYLNSQLPAIRSVGYRQAWQYLDGDITYEEMREKSIAATRQLAKRQFTWLRSWNSLFWLDSMCSKIYPSLLHYVMHGAFS